MLVKGGEIKVDIYAKGDTRVECPFDRETWGVNDSYETARRIDKTFIMDNRSNLWQLKWPEVMQAQRQRGFELITSCEPFAGGSRLYPIHEVIDHFGTAYFSCTISYMLAYAIYQGYTSIRMYGVDMGTHPELIREKGGVEFWIGLAKGRGIQVENTARSCLCRNPNLKLYGTWNGRTDDIEKERKWLF